MDKFLRDSHHPLLVESETETRQREENVPFLLLCISDLRENWVAEPLAEEKVNILIDAHHLDSSTPPASLRSDAFILKCVQWGQLSEQH